MRSYKLSTEAWWKIMSKGTLDIVGIYNDTLHLYTWYGTPSTTIVPPNMLTRFSFKQVSRPSLYHSFQVVHGGHIHSIQGVSVGTADIILISQCQTLTISLRPLHMVFVTIHRGRFCWKFQYMDLPETVLQEVRPVCCGW